MAYKTAKQGRFKDSCPRKLDRLPNTPCPSAIRRQELIAEGKRETPDLPGCPWSCNLAQDHYCSWVTLDRDDFDAMSVKEISSALGLSPAQVDKALQQAIDKLKEPEYEELLQTLARTAQSIDSTKHDNTLYLTYSHTLDGLAPRFVEDIDPKEIDKALNIKK
jgi:hypothetical protein